MPPPQQRHRRHRPDQRPEHASAMPHSIGSYNALIAIATHTDKNAAMSRRQQAKSGQ